MKKTFNVGIAIFITLIGLAMINCNPIIPPPPSTVINIAAIQGVTAPARGQTPLTTIVENYQYSGTVQWDCYTTTFAASTAYTATITLTPKEGYTLQGVSADFFNVAGAATVNNPANSGVITAVFPTTAQANVNPTITIDMYDSYGDGWDNGGALRIKVNGTDIATNVRVNSGYSDSYSFPITTGDLVQVYWVNSVTAGENSFVMYYTDEPPNPAFTTGNNTSWNGSNALMYRLRNGWTGVSSGTLLGSFTVGEEETETVDNLSAMYFYTDSSGDFTETDVGRTVVIADDQAEVIFYTDDSESEADRVGFTFEDSTIGFLFEKNGHFPGSMTISDLEESYIGFFTPYDPVTQTYGIIFTQGDDDAILTDIPLNINVLTQYTDDPELTPSQNLRMRNLYIAIHIYMSLDEYVALNDAPPQARGLFGSIVKFVAKIIPLSPKVKGTMLVVAGALDVAIGVYTIYNGILTAPETGGESLAGVGRALKNITEGIIDIYDGLTILQGTVHAPSVPTTVTGISLNINSISLAVGTAETLMYTITPANAANQNVSWSSSNTTVATVSNGTVTAKASGTATITVTTQDGGKTAQCVVTVSVPTVFFTVTFDANGAASGTVPSPQTVGAGSTITLPGGNSLTKTDFAFNGWNTTASGTGTHYNAGSSFTVTANTNLYVEWKSTNYTVYYYRGYPFNVNNYFDYETVKPGSTVTLPYLSSPDLEFWGWYTQPKGKGDYYSNGNKPLIPTDDISLYGYWGLNPVEGVTVSEVTRTSFKITWEPVPYALQYEVRVGSTEYYPSIYPNLSTSYTVTGLQPNTFYEITLWARRIEGNQQLIQQGYFGDETLRGSSIYRSYYGETLP